MERNSKDWVYNNKTVQSLFSATCGHYCVHFILYHCRGYSMRDMVSRFSSNLTENDRNIDCLFLISHSCKSNTQTYFFTLVQSPAKFTSTQKMHFFHLYF